MLTVIILLAAALAATQIIQLVGAHRTGRVRERGGTMTLKGQPHRFWRSAYSAYVVLLLCVVAIVWALISPNSF
jgi:hypothetical protein